MFPGDEKTDTIEQIAAEYEGLTYDGVFVDKESIEEPGYIELNSEKTESPTEGESVEVKWKPTSAICAKCIYKDTCSGHCSLSFDNEEEEIDEETLSEKEEELEK